MDKQRLVVKKEGVDGEIQIQYYFPFIRFISLECSMVQLLLFSVLPIYTAWYKIPYRNWTRIDTNLQPQTHYCNLLFHFQKVGAGGAFKKKMIRIKAAGADLSCFLVLHLGRAPKMLDLFSPAWCPGLSYSVPQFASRLSVIAEVALMSSPGLFCQTPQSRRKHHTSMSTG